MFSAKDLFFASQGGGYRISNSLRFRSSASAYLNRTYSSPTNNRIWSLSVWVKRGSLATNQAIIGTTDNNLSSGNFGAIRFTSSNTLEYLEYSSAYTTLLTTTQVFRDPSAWYHIVIAVDTTQATASNRIKMYVNGAQITAFSTSTYPSLNYNPYINSAIPHYFGAYNNSATGLQNLTDGYFTEVNFIDGQALTPSSFGETDAATGVWMPKKYTGTYGTNGFYLKFDEVGATTTTNTGYGKDSSGNANRWTTNNFGTTSTGASAASYDSMVDTPTNFDNGGNGAGNYCVLSPIDKDTARGTLVNANLRLEYTAFSSLNAAAVRGTMGVNTGKWYFEHINITRSGSGNSSGFVLANYLTSLTGNSIFADNITNAIGLKASVFNNNITFYTNGLSASLANGTTLFSAYVSGDVVNIAIDIPNGRIWIGRNGTWYNSGNPAAGTNATSTFTAPSGLMFPIVDAVTSSDNANQSTANPNFGQRPFANTPPSGFLALNTQNLTTPTILAGNKYFDVSTWTGNGTSQTITNGGFQPDFIWIKDRSVTSAHALTNTIAGITKYLESNTTAAETTDTTSVTAVNSNGFSLGAGTATYFTNRSGDAFVGWQWNAASSNTTNTSGSITSTVRANTTSGFSVVTFTAPASGSASVGHGLGVTPAMLIIKSRGPSTSSWPVWHTSLASTTNSYLNLETTGAAATFAGIWGSGPNSSVFGIGPGVYVASNNYVAYCFAPVAGYSSFGSYTGNGSTDGPFVYLGFRPKYILTKRTDSTGNWEIYDTSRDTYNVMSADLAAESSAAETSTARFDALSNGFKVRTTGAATNASGGTYIYAAFCENPFKISRAR